MRALPCFRAILAPVAQRHKNRDGCVERYNMLWRWLHPRNLRSGEPMKVIVRERGRRGSVGSCYAYFEVVEVEGATPHSIQIFAIDHAGRLIGKGTDYSRSYQPGMLLEVYFNSVPAEAVAQWQVQPCASLGSADPRGLVVVDADSEPGELSAGQIEDAHVRSFNIKDGYAGEVHGNRRAHVFHHPKCSAAKAMDDKRRRLFDSPDTAIRAGFTPCFNCLSGA